MSRKKRRTQKKPAPDRARQESVAAEKRKAGRSLQGWKPGVRPGVIWCLFGTAAALALLIYFLAIRPQKARAHLPDASALNILLITLDTTRADHLGCYGRSPAKTPHLDRLGAGGTP